MTNKELLCTIPKIDKLSQDPRLLSYNELSSEKVNEVLRSLIDDIRQKLLAHEIDIVPSSEDIVSRAIENLDEWKRARLAPVVNATGVVLHTNFGRSPLGKDVLAEAMAVCESYSNLEYDISNANRKSRSLEIEKMICDLVGAEDAIIVNNNVAAITLCLNSLSLGKEVILSRGEMVEIGGSFRLPEIIDSCGCRLVEVGTTNVTRIQDYSDAINGDSAVILKVNQSNFAFVGYSEEADLSELTELAHDNGLPCIFDMGSGVIFSLERFGINEITVSKALASGVDLVTFSCDKLLGGPQAGVIAGKKEYIDQIRNNPLLRALRVDKFTLAALQATLSKYSSFSQASQTIPALKMLGASQENLHDKASLIYSLVLDSLNDSVRSSVEGGHVLAIEEISDTPGGGCAPATLLPGYALSISTSDSDRILKRLRHLSTPIIACRRDDKVLFSVRTILDSQIEYVASSISEILNTLLGEQNA